MVPTHPAGVCIQPRGPPRQLVSSAWYQMAFDMAEGQKLVLQLCGQPEVSVWQAGKLDLSYLSLLISVSTTLSMLQGAVEADLKAAFSGKAKQFADVINKLANAHRITSKSRADGTRVYFAVDESHAAKCDCKLLL